MTPTETVVRFFHDVDRHDWAAVRAGLSDVVDTDYTSLFGGAPEQLPADDLVARWRGLIPGFDITQHLLGPVVLSADDAGGADDNDPGGKDERRLEANVRAHHRLAGAGLEAGVGAGAEEWMVAGRYAITARRDGPVWRVAAITLHTSYETGDRALVEQASARATEPGRDRLRP